MKVRILTHSPGGHRCIEMHKESVVVPNIKSTDDVILHRAVGRGATIHGPDVLAVQHALKKIPPAMGGAPNLKPDSWVGNHTLDAIDAFQQRQFWFHDGRVDVHGRTQAALGELQPGKLKRMERAHNHLTAALHGIRAAQAKILMAGVELRTGASPFSHHYLDDVDRDFSVTKSRNPAAALNFIGGIYTRMLRVFERAGNLWGWSTFRSEPYSHTDWCGFTYCGGFDLGGKFQDGLRLDTIYFSAGYNETTPLDRTVTIVHELAHFVGPPDSNPAAIQDYGDGLRSDPKMKKLTTFEKQHTAESYALFAVVPFD